jgi:hypothetical protein
MGRWQANSVRRLVVRAQAPALDLPNQTTLTRQSGFESWRGISICSRRRSRPELTHGVHTPGRRRNACFSRSRTCHIECTCRTSTDGPCNSNTASSLGRGSRFLPAAINRQGNISCHVAVWTPKSFGSREHVGERSLRLADSVSLLELSVRGPLGRRSQAAGVRGRTTGSLLILFTESLDVRLSVTDRRVPCGLAATPL